MPDSDTHLDLLVLDAARSGAPLSARETAHLAWCEACRAELDALRGLASDVACLAADVPIPAAIDANIRVLARQHAAQVRRRNRFLRPVSAAWAAAALVVVGLSALLLQRGVPGDRASVSRAAAPVSAPLDVDGDGQITVLDAMMVARRPDAAPAQVDRIMAAAVAVGGR